MKKGGRAYRLKGVPCFGAPPVAALFFFWLLAFSSPLHSQCPTQIDVLQPITCSGADDGVLSVSLPDGIGPEDVYWVQNTDTLFGQVQSGLGPGSYLAFIPGCPPLGVTLNEPFTFFITASISRFPTCDDPCSGEITVTPNFGQGDITYSWSHDAAETGPMGENVCEQVILVSAVDGNGCFDQELIVVEIPEVEVLTFPTPPSCFGFSDGAVSSVATGGLGGTFTFVWENASGVIVGNAADVSGLPAGGYLVTATDTGGCSASQVTFLDAPAPVDVEVIASGVSCSGASDGSASAFFSDAVDFAWTGPDGFSAEGPDLDAIDGLSPGEYSVLVTASDGCVGTGVVEVESPEPLEVEAFLDLPACPGLSDGVVGAVASGGTPDYTTQWTLPDGSQQTGDFLTGVAAGSYAYVTEDANGCSTAGSALLEDPVQVTVSIVTEDPLCAQGTLAESGSMEASVLGGLPPYQAVWIDLETEQIVALGLTANGLSAGTYGLGLSDAMGCTVDSLVTLVAPDSLFVEVTATNPLCAGEANGETEASASGGSPGYVYLWSGDVEPTFATGLTGLGPGNYVLDVTDADGCEVSTQAVLIDPETLVLEVESVPVGCSGEDGVAISMPSGGLAPYEIGWFNAGGDLIAAGDTATGFSSGVYGAGVMDANGCTASAVFVMDDLPAIGLVATWEVVDCTTGAASLTVSASGGDAPLEVGLEDSESGNLVDSDDWISLPPGDYVLTAVDQRGCFETFTFSINPPIEVVSDVTPAGCGGLGSAGLAVSGGVPEADLQFSSADLGPPSVVGLGSAMWEALSSGVYVLTVSDGICSVDEAVEILGVNLFDWDVGVQPYACLEAPGTISVELDGGLAPFSVTGMAVDGAASWSGLEVEGLEPGSYTLAIEDSAGCARDTILEVGILPPLSLEPEVMDISCFEAEDGAIDIVATGGAAPLELSVEGPDGVLSVPLEGAAPGVYIIQVMDDRGCSADTSVEVLEPLPLEVLLDVMPESCTGTEDGGVLASVAGGSGDIAFQWEGGPNSTEWTGLSAGLYSWTAVDENGCEAEGSVEVENAGGLTAEVQVSESTCEEGTFFGEVTIALAGSADAATVLLGGLPADEVVLEGGAGTWTWTDLAPGAYGWTASTGSDCTSSGQVEIEVPSALSFGAFVTAPLCEGGEGTVTCQPEGGMGPLTLLWVGITVTGDTLTGSETIVSLPAGSYTWTLQDQTGCARDTVIGLLAESVGLGLDQELTQPSCGGALAGSAVLTPSGGIAPYDLIVEGAADSTFLPFLVPGTYPVTLTDANGCAYLDTLSIEPASAFSLFAEVDSASCANAEDGQIALFTENAVGSIDYTFSGPFGAFPSGDTISDVGAGIYEVTALDSAGCPSVLLVAVGAPPPVVVLLDSLLRPSCSGDFNGFLSVSAEGGTGAKESFSYAWTLNGEPAGDNPELESAGEGNYAVEVTDEAGCTGAIASIPLVAEGNVQLSVPPDTALCAGSPLVLEAEATGANDASWLLPDGSSGVGLTAASPAISEGTFHWVFTASRLGCVKEDSVQVIGYEAPQPDAGPDVLIPSGTEVVLGAPGSIEGWTYQWFPASDVVHSDEASTSTQPLFSTTTFILAVSSAEGCFGSDTAVVEVLQELGIPSGFTPNGDGINDVWNLTGLVQYPSAQITVFNRWGDVLFTRSAGEEPWDGNLEGIAVPVGTYYYHIRVNEPILQTEWSGPLTIMR